MMLQKVYAGDPKNALKANDKSEDLLFNLEYGTLMRMGRDYDTSNLYYSKAQNNIDIWTNSWLNTTTGQASSTAAAMLINDDIKDYQAKDYEKTFLATQHALNHLDLNNPDNARIEIKKMYQVEQAIQNYNQAKYNEAQVENSKNNQDAKGNYLYEQISKEYNFTDINSPEVLALKNGYQNAFSHYLAGFVFEALGEPSLSRPGYVKAGQLNPTNPLIQKSIDNIDNNVRPKKGYTDLLIVEETGHAPQIKSEEIHIPFPANLSSRDRSSCINMVNIFYPRLVVDNYNADTYPFALDGVVSSPSMMVDVDIMAKRSIVDQREYIIARNVTAAIRNIALSQTACALGGSLGGLLSLGTSLGGAALDHADERTWVSLPNTISISRVSIPYGAHQISVRINGLEFTQSIILNQPYQIINFRVIGNQVYFNPQNSMVN